MLDQLRQAAERWQSRGGIVPPGTRDEVVLFTCQLYDAINAQRLADAYLAEHRSDDEKPVTSDWLLANGWTRYVNWPSIPMLGDQLLEWRGAGLWIGETPLVLVKGRGHIRRVLAALGIQVTERTEAQP